MERRDLEEIIACLPQERSHFRYFKDYYALQLLGWIAGEGISLEGLRRGPFAPLLQKPVVRPLLAACGDGRLDRQRVRGRWVEPSLPFLLTLGRWQGGGWRPPRSLYTRLPRRFCFREHLGLPRLLDNRRTARPLLRARVEPRFYRLSL
jgi:hypothetical protein